MGLMKISIAILVTIALSHVAQFAEAGPAPSWVPGTPCTGGCIVEIFDHKGIRRDGPTSAIFRVKKPRTPGGPAPYLDLYNPTFTTIERCVNMVRRIKKPRPGSVRLRAREYTLSGSDRVVFLVDRCRRLSGPGPGPVEPTEPTEPAEPTDGDSSACASGDAPTDTSCSISGGGWLSVTGTRSEADCQLGYTDSVHGAEMVIYDNSYSVTCKDSVHQPSVYMTTVRGDSNWGDFVDPAETCRLQIAPRPSDPTTNVVQKILCPSPP